MYDDLKAKGYLSKDRDTFNKFFFAPGETGYQNRKKLYDDLHSKGYLQSSSYEDFAQRIGLHSVRPSQTASRQQNVAQQANKNAAAQAAAAKSAPTQPTKGGWRPNAEQMAGYQRFTDGVLRTVKNGDDVMNRVNRQVARATRPNQQKVNLGFNNKHSLLGGGSQVQHEGKKFDAAKGDFVDQYSTEAGNVYDNTYEADAEQYNINRNKRDADTLDAVADIERQIREQEELLEKTRKASRNVEAPDNLWDAIRYTMSHADGPRLDQEDIDEEAIKAKITNLQNKRSLLLHGTSIGQKVGKSIGDQLAEVNRMIGDDIDNYYKRHPNGGPTLVSHDYHATGQYQINPYLDVAARSLEDAQEMFNEAGKSVGESGLTGFGKGVIRGFGSKLFDARTWDMGYTDLKGGLSLAEVLKRADEGKPLTVEQQKMLDAKATELACAAYFSGALGRGYKAGQVTAESIPFMLEFMLNPLSGTGRSAQAMLTRYALKRFGRKATMELGEDAAKRILYGDIRQLTKSVFDKGLSKGARRLAAKTLAGKASARIAGDITGAAGMTATTGQGRVAADMLNRATGQVKFGVDTDGNVKYTGHDAPEESSLLTAYGKAFGSQFSENYSEFMGPYISYVGGMFANGLKKIGGKYLFDGLSSLRNRSAAAVMKLPFAPMVSDFIREATKSDWAKAIKGMQKRAHWDGTVEEYLEEVAGNMLNAILVGDNDFSTEEGRGVFNLSDNIDTFLGVGLMSGAMSVASAAGYRTPAYRARKMVENADARGEKLLGSSLWGKFKSSFDAAQSEQDKQVILTSLLQNSSLTNEGRRAVLQYASGKQFQQAVADGTFREMEEDAEKGNKVERACRAEYAEGQNIDNVEEMRDAKTRYNVLLREALAVEPNAEMYSDPQFYEQSNPNATPEQKAAMRAYAEAKAQYEGVADRMKTDMADQQQKANEQVERFKNQTDGLITRVRLRGSDAEFYVTSGHISLNNDGTINDAATSSNLTIVDGEGNQRFISRGDVVDVLAQNTPEETLEQLNDIIMNEAKAKADLIDGKLSFRAGDTFTILNNEGQEQKVTIAQDPSTMAMSAVIEGEQAAVPLTEDSMAKLQQMSDAYQESRFGKYRQEQQDAVANAENEATQEEATPTSPTASQEEASSPTEGRSYGYGESVSYVDGEGHTQEGVVHGKTPDGTYEVEFDNPPSGKNVVDEYTQEELDALVQPIPAGQTEEAIPEPTALERVPINEETGEPMFEKADSETALDALNEVTGGNEDNTTAIVRAQVEQATKALEALKKKKPSKKAPSLKGSPLAMVKAQQEAEANYNTAMEEYNAQVAAAEENLNAWSRINSLMNDRKRAIREQQEAERKAREEELHAEAVARLEEDKRIAAEKAAEQEAVGTHAVNPKIKAKWDGATKVEGNPNAITLADGSTIRGHYVLTEAGAATASHDVNNAYEPTEGFPVDENGESVNDRDYKRDRDAQRIVRDMADSYDGRALQSPVIVSKDGVVLSGNNRTMSGEIAARQGTDKAYVAHLREFGAMFGFTPEQIDGMQHPRVVFVPDEELPYDANTFARFNAEQQKKQSKPEHAVKLGKIVPDNVFTSIVGDISRFDRMSDYYADGKAAASAISQLLDAGVINEMQLPELRTGNALSAAGKELIENTLIGKVFQTSPDAVRQIISTPTLRQSVVMGLNEIANNRTLAKSGYDLSKELAAAVDLVSRAKAEAPEIYKEGMPVSPYGRQQGLFDDEYGDSRVTDGVTLLLADLLNSGKPSDLRKVLSTYNHEAASPAAGLMDMFSGDVPSKEDVLNNVLNHFRNATPKEQQAIVDAAIAERKRRAEAAEPGGGSQGGEQTENAVRGSEETSAENLGGNQADGIQEKLTEEEADAMLDRMKSIADPMPEVELTPENWMNTFGLSNKIDTPIGEVKMGESQYAKLMEKKRSKEFGMVVGTITDPDVVFIEPSSAKDGQVTERAYSYVFVKTFKKEDENVRYYSSVTVSIDGMEISVSSHYINSNKAKKKLLELNRRYTKTALISNSSDGRLAEQQDAVPDLLPTQENNAVSDLPFPKDGVSVGEDTANSTELQGNGKESSHKGFVPDEKVIEENVQRSERALGLPSSVKREKTEVKVSDNGKVMVIKTDYSANGSKASVITLLAENDGQLDWAAQSFVDGKPTSELKYDYTLSYDDMMEMFDDNGAIRQDINPLKQIARNAGIDIDALLNGKEHGTKVSIEASREKTSENEGEKPLSAQIEDASADVNTDPTEAQKEAGNYKKGHVHVGSFDITIEQPQGSVRKGTDANGKQWESKMNNTYGYFRGTEGVDGDHIDVFLSNDIDGWNRQTVFVVDQYNPDGSFEEHKVMLGFNNAEEAKRDYPANYEKGRENGRRIDVTAVSLEEFEKWVQSSKRKTKPFSEYSSVKKEGSASSETKQSKSTAEEKPFNAIIEMLRKKFPDASMEALTAADRLLREQALPGERQKAIEAVAKALGLKVEWRDTMEKENGTFNPKTRTITIARDSEHALANTFGHEVTHAVRNLSEADYKNLKDAVRRLYSSEKEYNEAVQAYGDEYTGLDFDALEEELIADNIGFMIGGRNDMTQELASRMNHRVLWAIHDAMNKVRNALAKVLHIDSKKNGLLEVLDSARATIRETMANAQRIAKENGQGLSNESDSARQSLRMQDTASEFAEKYGVSADDVRLYAEGMKSGNLQKADWALSEIRRTMRVANRGMKLSEFGKLFRPIQKELAERYGDIERLRQEHIDAEMRERNLMEAAQKKAEEEERNRQARLEELSLLGDAEVDKRYMDALKRGDEATAREMLDEAARRKGYGDAESDYQGVGAWVAPSNPGYETDEARRNAVGKDSPDLNVEDMALGYSSQPSDYFEHPKRYSQDTPHGLESTQSIQKAIEAVKRGDKDVKVKVYRAVPTSVKEGKLRNGDWVTPSKKYAEMHGNSRLEGKYRIIEDEVPVDELWWDGNDANEWGYDNGKGYKYKNVKNNRKSDDLVTRDDKGNVIPPSKRFNQRKADERYQKRKDGVKPSKAEVALRDALVEHMRLSFKDMIADEEGQRVLDMANGRDTRFEAARHKSEAARRRDEMLRAIDQAKAFISGKTEQQTRAERRERERKFREETKVLYDRVLAGNFDSVTLQLLDDFINKVTPNNYYGRPLSKRLSERTLRKVHERERTSSVDALFSRISESAVPADERTRPEAKRRIEEKKKELLKGWAIATGNWHTAVSDFTDDTKPIGSGKDSVVYHSKDGKSVIKVSKGKESARKFRPDMDNVALFNTVFPASKYEIIGYGEIDGKFVRFLRQPIVDFTDSTPLSVEERVAYMERLGFRPMNDEKTAFTNGEIVASDIQGNNIVRDRDGNIRVIDADMRFHTKEFGGKYSYPAVETDTETAPNIREQRVYYGNGANGVRFFRTANGEAYGFTVGGKIYIDPRIATSETPVHEYAHLWATALKSANAKEWQNVVGLMKGTKVWDEVKALYPELKSDDEIADEVLATYSGRRGAERLREEQRRIAKGNGSVFEKAEAISALESVKQALKRFWKGIADFLHIHYTSAEEVADRVMKDLLDGVDPRSMMDGGRSLRPDTRINVVEGNTEHGFKNYAEAKDWAKEKIARTYNSEETGGKGDIRISNAAINKYLSQSAVDKSDSKDVHLSVLKVLPEVIRESVDAEQHADFKKGEDGVRSAENGINPNVTIHRLYGAVRMGGRLYRVKVTLKEDKTSKEPKVPHSYEATKIELFAGTLGNSDNSLSPNTNNSITAAKLLKGVEKSYGGGKFFEDYNKVREQFIGEQGAERADHAEEVTTRIDNLNVAREMEDAKKDAKAIKMATGWERGVDGKWRYEIPDLKYFSNGYAGWKKARARQPWIQELDALSDKLFEGEDLSDSEMARFNELADKESAFKAEFLNREKPHLADWVENDELFKAYPDLKRVNVVFTDQLPTNVGGSYNEREHTIVVNTNYVGDIDSVLAHEVQHAIQKIEGFARGGNPESIQERFKAAKKEWRARAWADELRYKADEMGEHYNQAAVEKALIDEYKEMGMDDDEWMPDKETRMKGFNYFARGYADRSMDADIKNFRLAESTRADFNPYMEYTKLGGEVESRNVEKRMGMSPEERRASLAAETEDVSKEDQIFLFGEGGTSMKTSSDLNEMFGNRWLDEQTNDDGRHTTQVKSTINSYKKFGDWVKRDSNGRDVDVLDASSGLGLGTAWMRDNGFKVDDVEPFPSDSREAPTFSSYDEIDKKYDYIISNAVLNVIPDDWRANVLHQMADKLKDGGKLVINVRGAESISKQGKEGETRITLDSPSEILVLRPNGSIKAYQKGFTKSELKEWCEKELGEGYSVEIANNKNAGGSYDTAVVVTKNNESDIETINTKFNEELQQQIDGTLPEGHIYKMGKPGRILLSTGVPNLPIQMNAKRLQVKATLFDHDFDLSEVKDLVRVLQHPLAVFAYGDKSKAQNIIVPLQKDGKNFIVGLSLNPTVGGRKLEINSIRNVFPKDNSEWLNWINQDKALYIDKEKIQTLIDQQRTNLADVAYLDLDSVANVMENFENPKVSDENVADGGIMFRNGGAADAEKQSRRGTPNLYPDHIAQAIYEQSVSGFKFDLDEAWHDSLLSVKRLQEAISETRGVPIRDFENAYWHAVALSSVNAAEMEQLMNLRIQPFIEAVQDLCKKHDLTQEDIEVYLNCKHGLERNEAMARKFAEAKAEEEFEAELKKAQKTATANPNDQAAQLALLDVQLRMNDRKHELYLKNREKDYSGLTDIFDPKDKVTGDRLDLTVSELEDKAKKCVDDFENKVGVVDVTKLWDNIHELNNYSLRKSYLSGLISKSQYDSVKQMYQWYVPLRGFNEEVAGDVYTYVTRGETRTQQLLKEAKGRTSRAGDILATMMNMANSAVNQGNRNLMKQKILNLALNAKSPLLSVSSTWYQTDANGFDVPIEPPINDQMTPSEQRDAIEQWEDTMEMLAKQGKVHRMSDNLRLNLRTQKWQADEHCIRVQRGGKEYCVWVNGNPRAAQALNDRLGNQVTKPYKATETILDKAEELFTDGFIKIFRYMAQSVTSLNPEFVISNFQRDLASQYESPSTTEDKKE